MQLFSQLITPASQLLVGQGGICVGPSQQTSSMAIMFWPADISAPHFPSIVSSYDAVPMRVQSDEVIGGAPILLQTFSVMAVTSAPVSILLLTS